jgi:hypothetical protein
VAGERCFIISEDVPLALDAFRKAYHDSLFTDSRLASSVKKILKFKYRELEFCQINITNLYKDLNSTKNEAKLRIV